MKKILIATLAAALAAFPAAADEVTDTLKSAIQAYEDGDIQYALEELAYAQQLLNEMKSSALEGFLPEPPDGWTMEKADEGSMAGMTMMGGLAAMAEYSNGTDSFTITIMLNNPMISAMAPIFGSAALMASQGKMVRVGRQKFIDQDGQLIGMVDGRIMVQAEGAAPEVMVPILKLINYRELGRFGL